MGLIAAQKRYNARMKAQREGRSVLGFDSDRRLAAASIEEDRGVIVKSRFVGQNKTAPVLEMPLVGAQATVETEGEMRTRFTMTRLALLGPFALAAKKKVDDRTLFLTVESPNSDGFVMQLKSTSAQARQFAMNVNNAARRAVTDPADPAA